MSCNLHVILMILMLERDHVLSRCFLRWVRLLHSYYVFRWVHLLHCYFILQWSAIPTMNFTLLLDTFTTPLPLPSAERLTTMLLFVFLDAFAKMLLRCVFGCINLNVTTLYSWMHSLKCFYVVQFGACTKMLLRCSVGRVH
jgi:hypothetical protein